MNFLKVSSHFLLCSIFFSLQLVVSTADAEVLMSGAAEERLEQGMDQSVAPQIYMDISCEYHWQSFLSGLEYFQSPAETTGQASLSLSRLRQGVWVTGAWQAGEWFIGAPYLRMGLGGYEESVTTALLGLSSSASSRVYMTGFGGFGLRFNIAKALFTAVEGRMIFGENLNPLPSMSFMARLGWEFNVF